MFKVMIVDDEHYILDGLAKLIEWNALGYKISGLFTKSSTAMEFARKNRPDLIITDIEMPGTNGLDMMAALRKDLPDTKFIILSAYDLFDYAQKAIQLGACQYLLKPIHKEKLTALLTELKETFVRQQQEKAYLDDITDNIDRSKRIITSYLVKEVFLGKFGDLDEETKKIYLSIKDNFIYQLVIVRFCRFLTEDGEYIHLKPDELKSDMSALEKNISPLHFHYEDCLVFVTRGLQPDDIQKMSIKNRNVFSLGLTAENPDLENAHGFLERAYGEFLQISFFTEKESCFQLDGKTCDTLPNVTAFLESIRETQGRKLLAGICALDPDAADKSLENIESIIKSNSRRIPVPNILSFYHSLFCMVKKEVASFLAEEDGLVPERQKAGTILHLCQFGELLQYFKQYVDSTIERLAKTHAGSKHIVNEVKSYVKSHFKDQHIKLNVIADKYFINYSYLSYIFKKQTGVNFYSYLLDIRLNEAMRLLRSTNLSINEIALDVGYPDSKNFHHLFKKHVGVAPNKYRLDQAALPPSDGNPPIRK